MKIDRTLRAALLGAGASAAVALGAQAETLRYAIGWPPGSTTVDAISTFGETAEELSGGDLQVKLYPLSLLNFVEAASGVRDGIADIVTILNPYFLAEFPASNFGAEMSGLMELEGLEGDLNARAGVIFGAAYTEWLLLNCPECIAEFGENNSVPLTTASSPSYILQCNKKVATKDELQGARIRAGGAWWSRWAEAMGATPVSMSVNETFEGLSQGVLDCTANAATELTNFSFIDVATDLTLGVPGAGFPSTTAVINQDVWKDLSAEDREILFKAAAQLSAEVSWIYYKQAQDNLETAREKGIEIHEASEELLKASREHIRSDVDTMISSYNERFGIGAEQADVDKMRELIAKWTDLVGEAQSPDEVADVMRAEIYDKLDPSSFGL